MSALTGPLALRATWLATQAAARVSTPLAGRAAARLWFTPWRVPVSDKVTAIQGAWLAQTTPLAVPFEGTTLAGFAAGQGPVVLLVHGWGDRASRLGSFIAPLVDAGFGVVGVDLPAHGDSPGTQTNAYDIARAIRVTAEHVGGISGVVAHSMGGLETVLALREGLGVDGVVLLAPAVRLDHAVAPFARVFQLPERALNGLRRQIERRFGAAVWDDVAGDALARDLVVPALIVHDRSDPQVAFDDAQLLAAGWRGSRFVATDGLGHHRLLRDESVVASVTDFLVRARGAAEHRLRPQASAH